MSRFLDTERWDALCRRGLETLEEIIRTHGLGVAERVAATAFAPRRWQLILHQGYAPTDGARCVGRLVTKGTCRHFGAPHDHGMPHSAPGADHEELLEKNGEPAAYVSQCYDMGWETLRELVGFCREHRLRANFECNFTWHFPGRTMSVWITPEGE